MRSLAGMAALAADYDGYIVDLWGTVHDGIQPYPGAIECLEHLRAAGKRVVMLSNAPRPAADVTAQLRGFGIADSLHDGVFTSGEMTRQLLRARHEPETARAYPWLATLGHSVLHIGGEHDLGLFEGLDLQLVSEPEDADFVLNTGPDEQRGRGEIEPYLPHLAACATLRLPMVCANPDMEVIRGGVRLICAGMLAKFYEQRGGVAHWLGKPFADVYPPVFRMLGVDPSRIIGIGDALATDIKGAAAAGIASCWVLGGIHGEKLGDDPALAEAEASAAGLSPVATVPSFIW